MGDRRYSNRSDIPLDNIDKDRWNGAIIQDISPDTKIQIAGIDDNLEGHTCFARLLGNNQNETFTLNMIVSTVKHIIDEFYPDSSRQCSHGIESAAELVRIGAVWLLPDDDRKRPRRAVIDDNTMDVKCFTIRIHHGAKRFLDAYNYQWGMIQSSKSNDNSKNNVILYEDISLGFAVLNKPSGVPVHGYVYNSVENVIYMYQSALFERYPNESFQFKVSAPQRLDNDTSGVLILSIKSPFASYMGKLLEAKTLCHVGQGTQIDHPPTAITKFYKMLVCIKTVDMIKNLQKLASTKELVTHYLSPERSERRIFSMVSDDVRNDSKWLECNLKVISVGFNASVLYLPVNRLKGTSTPAPGEGSFSSMSTTFAAVTEVEVELLTGRTHQIRGQMAALGFPLVGDLMYGGDVMIRHQNKIALHCSQITFPKPVLVDEPPSDRNKRAYSQLHPSTSDSLTVHTSCTWWDDYISV